MKFMVFAVAVAVTTAPLVDAAPFNSAVVVPSRKEHAASVATAVDVIPAAGAATPDPELAFPPLIPGFQDMSKDEKRKAIAHVFDSDDQTQLAFMCRIVEYESGLERLADLIKELRPEVKMTRSEKILNELAKAIISPFIDIAKLF